MAADPWCVSTLVFLLPTVCDARQLTLVALGGLDDTCRECTGFLIMPKRPYEWRVGAHGCNKFDNADLGFGTRGQTAHFPIFLHLRVTNLPAPDSTTRSFQAQQRRMERPAGKNERKRLRKAACGASRLESFGHAAQIKSPTEPHTTAAPAFSQYRHNGNTEHFGSHAAANRLCTSAPSVNDFQCFLAS